MPMIAFARLIVVADQTLAPHGHNTGCI
jgi:hypothetical protein